MIKKISHLLHVNFFFLGVLATICFFLGCDAPKKPTSSATGFVQGSFFKDKVLHANLGIEIVNSAAQPNSRTCCAVVHNGTSHPITIESYQKSCACANFQIEPTGAINPNSDATIRFGAPISYNVGYHSGAVRISYTDGIKKDNLTISFDGISLSNARSSAPELNFGLLDPGEISKKIPVSIYFLKMRVESGKLVGIPPVENWSIEAPKGFTCERNPKASTKPITYPAIPNFPDFSSGKTLTEAQRQTRYVSGFVKKNMEQLWQAEDFLVQAKPETQEIKGNIRIFSDKCQIEIPVRAGILPAIEVIPSKVGVFTTTEKISTSCVLQASHEKEIKINRIQVEPAGIIEITPSPISLSKLQLNITSNKIPQNKDTQTTISLETNLGNLIIPCAIASQVVN